jgi:hypothetical protein
VKRPNSNNNSNNKVRVKSPVSDTSDKPGFRTITNKDIPTSISTSHETDSEVMECEMVELFAADSVDLTGEEVDDDFDFSLDCPGEVDIDVPLLQSDQQNLQRTVQPFRIPLPHCQFHPQALHPITTNLNDVPAGTEI